MTRAQLLMAAAGVALVIGFFLPWIDVEVIGRHRASGFDILREGGKHLSTLSWIALLACPLLGLALTVNALAGTPLARPLGIAIGGLAVLYIGYELFRFFRFTTGVGLWLVLGGCTGGLVGGLMARKGKLPSALKMELKSSKKKKSGSGTSMH